MENSAKILLLGKTGVGKSSFVNYFLGEEKAVSDVGKPVTQNYFESYEFENGRYPVEIFDTKGLEALGSDEQLKKIINGIKERNNSDDILNWFHTIFYCVSMANPRFEDFEVNFIRRLQDEVTQHIHIILTHCDSVAPEVIAEMRHKITSSLKGAQNIEIFEVVCVDKVKRNGKAVKKRGREEVSARVFELFLKEIAFKVSSDYAKALRIEEVKTLYYVFSKFEDYIDEVIRLKTLIGFAKNEDETMARFDEQWKKLEFNLDREMDRVFLETNEKFKKILRPIAHLYQSYFGIVVDSYVNELDLAFEDSIEWMDVDWMDVDWMDDEVLTTKIFPRMGEYINADKEPNSVFEVLGMFGSAIIDLVFLKKNCKKALGEFKQGILDKIPSQEEIQSISYQRILEYMKPPLLPFLKRQQAD